MSDEQHRAKYEQAVEKVRDLANRLGAVLGPVDAAGVLEVAAAELRVGASGAAQAAEFYRTLADAIERQGGVPASGLN